MRRPGQKFVSFVRARLGQDDSLWAAKLDPVEDYPGNSGVIGFAGLTGDRGNSGTIDSGYSRLQAVASR